MSPYANPEDQKAHDRLKYREHRTQVIARTREYYQVHKSEILKRKLEHYKPKRPIRSKAEQEQARAQAQLEITQRWQRQYPDKLVAECVARRHTVLGKECSICGSKENLQRHHPDYSKPLEVVTVCCKCHCQIHPRRK